MRKHWTANTNNTRLERESKQKGLHDERRQESLLGNRECACALHEGISPPAETALFCGKIHVHLCRYNRMNNCKQVQVISAIKSCATRTRPQKSNALLLYDFLQSHVTPRRLYSSIEQVHPLESVLTHPSDSTSQAVSVTTVLALPPL